MADDNGRRTLGQIEAQIEHQQKAIEALWTNVSALRRDVQRLAQWRAWLTGAMLGVAAIAGRNFMADVMHLGSEPRVAANHSAAQP